MSTRAHLLVALVTFGTMVAIVRLVRRGLLGAKYSMLWLSIGSLLAALVLIPGSLDRVSAWVGIYYPPALYFLLATSFLFLVVIHLSYELSRLEARSRTVAEEIAMLRDDVRQLRDQQEAANAERMLR